jgi:hypothetical protein
MLSLVRISPRTDGKSTTNVWNGKTNSILFSIRHAYFSAEAGYLAIRVGYWRRGKTIYCNIALHELFSEVGVDRN